MANNILRKSSKNFMFSTISLFCTALLGLIVTPIIIVYIGKSEYGVYRLILEFLGYLAICDLGLSTSSCSLLSDAWQKGDRKYVIKTIKVLLRQYFKLIPLAFITLAIIGYIFFNFSVKSYDTKIVTSFIIMGLSTLLMPLNVFRDFLIASERTYIFAKYNTFQLIAMNILNVVFSYMGYGLIGLSIAFSSIIVLYNIILVIVSYQKITLIPILNLEFKVKIINIWKLNLHSFIQNILGKLCYATDTIIVSFFFPAATLTYFITNQRLAMIINRLLTGVGHSTWASIAMLKNDKTELQKVINLINKFFAWITFPLIFSMACNNQDFISLWLGKDFYVGNTFTWIIAANYLVFCTLSFWGWIFISVAKIHLQTKTILIAGIINITSSVLLTKYIGVVGPALGTCISFYGFYIWHIKKVMTKQLDINVNAYIYSFLKLLFAFAILYPFSSYIKLFPGKTWITLLSNMTTTFLISIILSSLILIRKDDFIKISNLIKGSK